MMMEAVSTCETSASISTRLHSATPRRKYSAKIVVKIRIGSAMRLSKSEDCINTQNLVEENAIWEKLL
jgi:hypothetical protein